MGKKKRKKKPIRKTHKTVSTVHSKAVNVQPRFTVAMATYNRAQWLPSAIESVLSQSFSDFEYVIVDDGSTDNTAEVIRGYKDTRIRYIQKPNNEGRPATRNRVVAESSGEYILWMADDDRLAPDILARYHEVLIADPSIDVLYGNLAVFSEEFEQSESAYEPVDWSVRSLDFVGAKLSGSVLPDPGTATRLSIVKSESGPYDLEFLRAQDYELWSRVAHKINVKKVDDIIYFYRQHTGSASFGDFVDTTFESKVIRAHRARHIGSVLAPQFDWNYETHATARLNLIVAESLNEYRDGYNALRFACAIPQWYCEPLVLKQVVLALSIQGRLDDAERVTQRAIIDLPYMTGTFTQWQSTIDGLRSFAQETEATLSQGIEEERLNLLQTLVNEWGWTYDLARVFAHLNRQGGDLKKAALAFCYAARLNLEDEACAQALRELAPQVSLSRGKIDLQRMRERIQETHVELGHHITLEPQMSTGRISILDLVNKTPQPLLDALSGQPVGTYEIVGFYKPDSTHEHVVSCPDVEGLQTRLAALSQAATGDWVVLADEGLKVYPHWSVSVLSGADFSDVGLQFCAQHEPDPESDGAFLSLRSMTPVRSVYAGQAVPMHRFAVAAHHFRAQLADIGPSRLNNLSVYRLYYASHWLNTAGAYHHVGATQLFQGVSPDYEAAALAAYFCSHQKSVLFDREVRRAQNALLSPHQQHFQDSGRVTVAVLSGGHSSCTQQVLRALFRDTYAPAKALVLCNAPSDELLDDLRSARDEFGELSAIVNHRAVADTKLFNQALTRMGAENIVLLDPSVNLTSQWLSRLLWRAKQTDNLGILCVQFGDDTALDFRCCLVTKQALTSVGGLSLSTDLSTALADFAKRVQMAGLVVEQTQAFGLGLGERDHSTPLSSATDIEPRRLGDASETLYYEYAPEPGFLPDAPPVTLLEARDRRVLVYPPWTDTGEMRRLIETLKPLSEWTIYLRCAELEGVDYQAKLLSHLDAGGAASLDDLDVQLVDVILAPDREAGLFTAVDLIYADQTWSASADVAKRAIDCGTTLVETPLALHAEADSLTPT